MCQGTSQHSPYLRQDKYLLALRPVLRVLRIVRGVPINQDDTIFGLLEGYWAALGLFEFQLLIEFEAFSCILLAVLSFEARFDGANFFVGRRHSLDALWWFLRSLVYWFT